MTPERKRTDRATETNRRRGDNTAASRLIRHGWLVVTPEQKAGLPPEVLEHLMVLNVEAELPSGPPAGERPLKGGF